MDYEINSRILKLRKALNMSQTEFGKNIGVSRGVINNIDLNIVDVTTKPLLVEQICKEYNVNRTWLETGEGEMFNDISRDTQIAEFVGEALADEDDTFKKRLISALAGMTVEEWEVLGKLITRLANSEENKKESE